MAPPPDRLWFWTEVVVVSSSTVFGGQLPMTQTNYGALVRDG
jgi:hypothetical protein